MGDDDQEIKNDLKVNAVQPVHDIAENVEKRVSNWCKLKRIIELVLIYLRRLLLKVYRKKGMVEMTPSYDLVPGAQSFPDLKSVQMAESVIIKSSQRRYFSNELKILEEKRILSKKSSIYKLDPYLDKCGLLRVGGRIQKSAISEEIKHPVLLARNSEIAVMIIRWCHEKVAHSGRGITMNYIRSSGFWIINCNAAVRSYISKCVACRHLRGNFKQQKMPSLPSDRLCEEPPFTYCGVDIFRPFVTKDGRKELKRHGPLFTCLSSRAIHIERVFLLNTHSIILCLCRFVGRRGNIRLLTSDNGSNFVGASSKFNKAFAEIDQQRINDFMRDNGDEWMLWKQNPPSTNNSARAILTSLLKTHGTIPNDESLHTLLIEVE